MCQVVFSAPSHRQAQRGNALFLILIAVALFAALSYAITHSDRGGNTIAREQALIDAGVSQDCTARVEQAVLRLETLGGCTSAQINYELADGTNHNADAPVDKHCNVFDTAGAGESPCGSYLEADEGGTCSENTAAAGEVVSGGACDGLIYVSNTLGSRLYTTATSLSPPHNWSEAMAACDDLGAAWRLPTTDELGELFNARHTGALNGTFDESGAATAHHWASDESGGNAWYNHFSAGSTGWYDKTGPNVTGGRCVRN